MIETEYEKKLNSIEVGIIKKLKYLEIFKTPLKDQSEEIFESTFQTTIERVPEYDNPASIRNYVIRYRTHGIKDMYGISLREYMQLSSEEMRIMGEVSTYINNEENKILKDLVEEENEGSNNIR